MEPEKSEKSKKDLFKKAKGTDIQKIRHEVDKFLSLLRNNDQRIINKTQHKTTDVDIDKEKPQRSLMGDYIQKGKNNIFLKEKSKHIFNSSSDSKKVYFGLDNKIVENEQSIHGLKDSLKDNDLTTPHQSPEQDWVQPVYKKKGLFSHPKHIHNTKHHAHLFKNIIHKPFRNKAQNSCNKYISLSEEEEYKENSLVHRKRKNTMEEGEHQRKTLLISGKSWVFGKKKKNTFDHISTLKTLQKIKQPLFYNFSFTKYVKDRKKGIRKRQPVGSIPNSDRSERLTLARSTLEKLKREIIKKIGFTQENSYEEIEFYPLIKPFAYVSIIRGVGTPDRIYILNELELTDKEKEHLDFIIETLGVIQLDTFELEAKGSGKFLRERVDQIIEDYSLPLTPISKKKITYYLKKELLGLGKLEPLMNDPNIEDISCDGSEVPIFLYHRKHGSLKSNVTFQDEDELSAFVVKLSQKCGKHISIANPMIDATLPDGSRIQMTLSDEVTTKGSTFTIRKFMENPFSPADLIEFNTMSSEMVAYLWMAVQNGVNALFAGGTASGKTSSLNAIALFIPHDSKIVSIEETREINLPHPNWIPGVSRSGFGEVVGGKVIGEIDMYDLMKAALRQRPEYILVGEIRGREAYVLFQAMATGHTTYSTVHADSAKSLIHRLEGRPINIPRIMLQSLDIVCLQTTTRVKDKRARRIKQIIEIIDIDPVTKEILTNEVFRWDPIEDKFLYSGKSYVLEQIRIEKDLSREQITSELKRRAFLLDWMEKKDMKDFKEVATITAKYIENPDDLMIKVHQEMEGSS